jgi:hypothetical protein
MWVFTQTGYISVVDKGQHTGYLTARSRDKQSLAILSEIADSPIEFTPMADYQYRTLVKREHLTEFLTQQVETLNYSNFKDQIWQTRGDDFHHACGDVWVAMNAIKDEEAQEWYADRYAERAAKRSAARAV